MFLKRIELNGFKSFPEKYEILMDDKITGIVGPNGSGKSNIGDAVRWVLGEQSAKSLRGERMEDIIFNGTQLRKQKSYCEVSLTFNNANGRILSDYSEIEVTRKMYRSGESEYYINKQNCRLKDILDLFRDTGIGKEGYSIIGQGKIDEILNEKAISRRKVFEEAAGIMKYRVRKEESERKLAKTEENLTRVHDIIDELEYQIEPLKAQCEDAKRYLKLKEKQKDLEINIFLNTYERGKDRIEKLKKELKGLEEENVQKTFELAGLKNTSQSDDEIIDRIDNDLLQINYTISTNFADIERFEGDARLEAERKKHLAEEIKRLEAEVAQGSEAIGRQNSQNAQAEASLVLLKDTIAQKEGFESQLKESILSVAQGSPEDIEPETMQQAYKMLQNEFSEIKSLISSFAAKKDSLEAKDKELENEISKIKEEIQKVELDENVAQTAADQVITEKSKLLASANETTAKIKDLEVLYKNRADEKAGLQRKADSISSRIKMLQDMRDSHEGYIESVKALLSAADRDPSLKQRIIGPVAEQIQVPELLEIPIEAVLGTGMQNIIVNDEYAAKALIEHLRKNSLGKVTFLPLQALKAKGLSNEEKALINRKGVLGIASELIKTKPNVKKAIDFLLARTVITEDMDTAITIMREAGYSFRTVTLEGDVLNPGGVITGGSQKQKAFGLVSRDRMQEQAVAESKSVLEAIGKINIDEINEKLEALVSERQILLNGMHQKDLTLISLEEKKKALENIKNDLKNRVSGLKNQLHAVQSELLSISAELKVKIEKQEEIQAAILKKEALIHELEQKNAQMNIETQSLKEKLSAVQIELASLYSQRENRQRDLERIGAEIQNTRTGISEKEQRMLVCRQDLQAMGEKEAELQKSIVSERAKAVELDRKLKEIAQYKETVQAKIKSKALSRQNLQDSLNTLLEKRLRFEMQITKLETDIENAQNRIWEDYQLTYLNAVELRSKTNLSSAQQEIENIREEIRLMGNINPNAVDDYNRVLERRNFLASQRADLEKAIEDLQKVIEELMHNMRTSFKDRFQIINEYFKEAFTELFGGGSAYLKLQDDNDIMESGIDIIAEPPGKRLQNISLLSGGEKAMTAIALLFAMQKLNPSPVCLLDEIDAALDDANIDRFTEYIMKYTKKVQFVIITHRKPTMAICDTLYGIAMEEKGVSRMLSVKLA